MFGVEEAGQLIGDGVNVRALLCGGAAGVRFGGNGWLSLTGWSWAAAMVLAAGVGGYFKDAGSTLAPIVMVATEPDWAIDTVMISWPLARTNVLVGTPSTELPGWAVNPWPVKTVV